ncbi:amidase signature domain-containing protein [Mycotypha africana]|uniref:amidase signature domain-containing protein n=1 Tax=Mycotypha africana TaxID=64632 RepID=UPI0023009E22|nr:amidase signature domain-containing protein [Mycotypha africana]KAI8979361.1 amidase signature domain-containing protein [Mycotypha africana]
MYGLPLLMAANAIEYVPMLKQKIASDALLLKLRERNDIEEHPTTLPIPSDCFHEPKNALFDPEIPRLNPEHKSQSPFLSFWDYHEAYCNFTTTPTEVAEKLLEQLKKSQRMSWVRFVADDILEQAKQSTERYKQNAFRSQMDGCFMSVKEEVDIQGLETKVGTCFINDGRPAEKDATLVRKLRNAGVIIVGSAVMNELGWDTFSVNPNTGIPKNPYKPTHSCGGSSGGSGGCVAGGLFPVSIGADGGGSVRIPSAFCGLYGLKTTHSRVSAHGGATLDPSLGSYGPLAATADDMTLAYTIISGPDKNDVNTWLQPPVSLQNYDRYRDLSDITIGVFPGWGQQMLEPAIHDRYELLKEQLLTLGARITEIEIPDIDLVETGEYRTFALNVIAIPVINVSSYLFFFIKKTKQAHTVTICSEMFSYASRFSDNHTKFLPHTRLMAATASVLDGRDYVRAQQVRTRMMNHLRHLFEDQQIDLILSPTTALVAPEIPAKAYSHGMSNAKLTIRSMVYCMLANLTGIPAVNVPVGFHPENGMPIGMQFMAKWWDEALLCRIAKTCELSISGVERKHPPSEHWFANGLLPMTNK